MNNFTIIRPDASLMRFFAFPVLTDFNVGYAPVFKITPANVSGS
jgi:hypothetical protein